jgi:four helix bundle protein
MEVNSNRDVQVWQKGMRLAKDCYFLTREFPREEMYGMVSQIRRAATSVPAKIAEGYGRESTGDYIKFLRIAQGSLRELETHLLLTAEVELTTRDKTQPLLSTTDEIGRMLRSLVRSLQSKQM